MRFGLVIPHLQKGRAATSSNMPTFGLSSPLLRNLRPYHHDLGAAARPAFNSQRRADRLSALAHNVQPQMLERDSAWIETLPIVADLQLYAIGPAAEADCGLGGVRMASHIVQRFLGDTIQTDLHVGL